MGNRISIKTTRTLLNKVHDGSINLLPFTKYPIFGFEIPTECDGIDSNVLDPRKAWVDLEKYNRALEDLFMRFKENYDKKLKI